MPKKPKMTHGDAPASCMTKREYMAMYLKAHRGYNNDEVVKVVDNLIATLNAGREQPKDKQPA